MALSDKTTILLLTPAVSSINYRSCWCNSDRSMDYMTMVEDILRPYSTNSYVVSLRKGLIVPLIVYFFCTEAT